MSPCQRYPVDYLDNIYRLRYSHFFNVIIVIKAMVCLTDRGR